MFKSTTGVEHYELTENKRVFPEEVPSQLHLITKIADS